MILLDDRGHDPALLPYFHPYGVDVESTTMDASDVMFAGNGIDGQTVSIGLERKRVSDAASSIRSDRLAGFQLDGLMEFDFPFIILEGRFRPQRGTGLLELWNWKDKAFKVHRVGRSPMMFSELIGFMWTMQLICGIRVMRTQDAEETAAQCVSLYHWFDKPWDKHKAHMGIYTPVPERNGHKAGMVRRKPSLAVKIAAQLPGVDQKAWQVGEYFGGVDRMMNASRDDWREALGIKDKKSKTVDRIIEALT